MDEHVVRLDLLEEDRGYQAYGELFGDTSRGMRVGPLSEPTVLTPVEPGKMVAVGRNDALHATESDPDRTTNCAKQPHSHLIFKAAFLVRFMSNVMSLFQGVCDHDRHAGGCWTDTGRGRD